MRGNANMYLGRNNILVYQVSAKNLDHLHLLFSSQPCNSSFKNTTNAGLVDGNEAGVVHKGNGAHDELAVHAVRHASVARNRVAKVLDFESTLQA